MIVEQAPAIPYIWDKHAIIRSANVQRCERRLRQRHWDLSFTSLK